MLPTLFDRLPAVRRISAAQAYRSRAALTALSIVLSLASGLPQKDAHGQAQTQGSALTQLPAPAGGPIRVEAVVVELVSRQSAVAPGQTLELGLRLQHDPDWHSYWRNPGDSGLPTQLELTLPAGFEAGAIQWPAPQRHFIPPLANYGYEGEVVLPVPVQVPATVEGSSLRVEGKASWLICRDVCIPGEASVSLVLPVVRAGAASPSTPHAALFEAAHARMPTELLEVAVSVEGERLSLGLPEPLSSAEFFPLREGLIRNAAPQPLYAIEAAGQPPRRLEVALVSETAKAAAAASKTALEAAEGVLVAGERVFELRPVMAERPLATGVEIARVAGAPDRMPPSASSFRLPGFWGGSASERAMSSNGPTPGALQIGPNARGESIGDTDLAGGRAAPGGALDASADSGLANLLVAALFAVIGGLILNLMPCVFPVIGLKVLGFARHGGSGDAAQVQAARSATRASAWGFSAGVLASFWVLAAALLALRAAGQAAGWGFQLQSPAFVASMALLFVAIALNFSGVFEFGTAMTRLGQFDPAARPFERRRHSSLGRSFGSGVLAVLVATPCTAPFMGSALGFTLSAGAMQTLIVFTALGLGMALPYLLLGLFPVWLRWLPRPGRWMESFRQALAFPMYATAAWLAWVLGQQAGIDAMLALAVGAVLLALAAWLYGRFVQRAQVTRLSFASARRRRAFAASLAVLALAAALTIAWPTADPLAPAPLTSQTSGAAGAAAGASASLGSAAAWQPWSVGAVARARAAGQPVFVDFTAAWCVSCQVNKQLVLDRAPVVQAMARAEVLRLRADWTSRDPEISAELARHGRNSVPLYLLFQPGQEQPVVLPELLTQGIVLEALARLGSPH